ncbi:chitin synthase chs-2-like isoform X2 [Biomphalaria pfeifferi]|uniref:chitin synthase n=1 Tax=Biomphalaria pfeifferi TaxID=112525 RepID=A0AAD8C9J9_BIOPF|nr:chitin synthase chs-2-like isoform X2 [Biomphalaria pfeifferi]
MTLYFSLIFKLDEFRSYPWPCVLIGLTELARYNIWFAILCCCCGGALCSLNVWAAFKVGLSAPGVKIPFILAVPLSIVITGILWNDFETGAFWELTATDVYAWTAIGLSTICWLIPFIFPAFAGFKCHNVKNRRVYSKMNEFSWNVLYLQTRLLLMNYEECETGCALKDGADKTTRSTVYICTTMYKESPVEMLRYLTSIQNIFEKKHEKKMNLEAHVFVDNSIRCDKINSRARQLLSLLCDTFQLTLSQLVILSTPYGCQVNTSNLLDSTLYIHFKDKAKVKCKKRWSQVMYLNYVLHFRQKSKNNGRDTLSVSPKHQCEHYTQLKSSSPGMSHYILNSSSSAEPTDEMKRNNDSLSLSVSQFLTNIDPSRSLLSTSTLRQQKSDSTERFLYLDSRLQPSLKSSSSFSSDSGQSSSIDSVSTQTTWDTDKLFMMGSTTLHQQSCYDDVFILTTDADTEFNSKSLFQVLEKCQSDGNVGAVCGRTVPIGALKPIVWYQKFEYAKDFWLVKSSQNVIGSVTCCPGCFSIYRGAAMATVLPEFCKPTTSAFENLIMDHGEDRWLCTLLMQRGWRLAYSSSAHNSTHCPETVGEFLRQRRRWVLSELSNTADIFLSIAVLVRNNSSFSAMFLISLLSTFLWVILSPATTVVFMCAGFDVLYSVPMTWTLPVALAIFLGYCLVSCLAQHDKQKIVSILMISLLAATVFILSTGFILYIVNCISTDVQDLGYIQFRPYFLVFLLIIAIVYAAALHPKESQCLIYGFAYAMLFPAMFVVLPVYGVANMLDQSWGTREAGSHGCCQSPEEEEEDTFTNYDIKVSSLQELSSTPGGDTEHTFWNNLINVYIGNDVNKGKPNHQLTDDLHSLRGRTMLGLTISNFLWFICLSLLYAFAGSDVICYCVAAIFSFSLVIQLIGLTCFKFDNLIESSLNTNVNDVIKQDEKSFQSQTKEDFSKITLHGIFEESEF